MIKSVRLIFLVGLLGLTACGGIFTPPTLTPTVPLASPTDTPTIAWFPATNTPTVLPTPTVALTVEQLPGLGELLFADRFAQASLWSTATSSQASAVVQPGRLVLSITAPGPNTIVSLRSTPALGDFYAEATASLSLCQGDDEYGMVFRANSGDNYYRFTVNCRSQVRLERALSAVIAPLQDWILTGDAPPGAPAQIKLGVWAVGSEMRFFLNNNYQFTVHDPILHVGTLGFFVSASAASPITVAFSDLSAFSVTYVSPTSTPVPSRTPLASRVPTP